MIITKTTIELQLQETFPTLLHLEVTDDSHQHKGHAGWREGGGTHFSILLVTPEFTRKTRVQRHQMVYQALAAQMQEGGIHALAIRAMGPEEWGT